MWTLVATMFITSLLTVAIAGVSLWLGWTARDRVGVSNGETHVGPTGFEDRLEEPVTLEDYIPREMSTDND